MLLGLEKEAMIYSKKSDMFDAIDMSIKQNRWNDAYILANRDGAILNTKVNDLAAHKTRDFLSEGNTALAIQTYRAVKNFNDAANLLREVAENICKGGKNLLVAKKLFVLAARDIESSQHLNIEKWSGRQTSVEEATFNSLESSVSVYDYWRGAAACHYYLLSHRQFYKAKYTRSMMTALRCSEYVDFLPAYDVYALIALTAYHGRYFKIFSKAMKKMMSLQTIDEHIQRWMEDLVRNTSWHSS